MTPLKQRVLVVDDELGIRFALTEFLRTQGLDVYEAENCRAAEEIFRTAKPDVVITDNFLPDGTALELMPKLKAIDPYAPILILTAHGSIDLAVRAIKEGADQFLTKPLELKALLVVLERLLEAQRRRRRDLAERNRVREANPFLGSSRSIHELEQKAWRVAKADSAIVIQGETGSGKGVFARWLHRNSRRAEEPFVDLNCAGLSREFLETELFGHEKGAFTSAVAMKPGLLEIAHRGTLFLDEIGDIDPQVQPKVLKVLEDKHFRRLGEVKDRSVDVRLIAASHHDLSVLVKEGRFRSDLYFRINTIPLRVPALRERVEDIPVLAETMLEELSYGLGRPRYSLDKDAIAALQRYHWPGNVRELRNILERAILLGDGTEIKSADLFFDRAAEPNQPASISTSLTLEQMERSYIQQVLHEVKGKVDIAATRLAISRSSLYEKIKRFGLQIRGAEGD